MAKVLLKSNGGFDFIPESVLPLKITAVIDREKWGGIASVHIDDLIAAGLTPTAEKNKPLFHFTLDEIEILED